MKHYYTRNQLDWWLKNGKKAVPKFKGVTQEGLISTDYTRPVTTIHFILVLHVLALTVNYWNINGMLETALKGSITITSEPEMSIICV